MKAKIAALVFATGLAVASFAGSPVVKNAASGFRFFEEGVIYYNPLTGEVSYEDCNPTTRPSLCPVISR